MSKPVILTGLRANNDLHIGNYFGALLPLVDMARTRSDEFTVNLFVPDLHSFTTPIDHTQLQAQIMHNLKLFVAAGLPFDNPDIHLYRQSYIPAHSELTVLLNNFTYFGELSRMTQFKDKVQSRIDAMSRQTEASNKRLKELKGYERVESDGEPVHYVGSSAGMLTTAETVTAGLFDYPVLMAADILLYGAMYVPVGDDQSQHLEITRDIAQRVNRKFGDVFVVPEPVKKQHEFFGKDQGLRIKDLQDPAKKMSKSDESGKGIIFLGDDPEVAGKKIKSAATDSLGKVDPLNPDQPGIRNLLQILALTRGRPLAEVTAAYAGQTQYGPLKADTAEAVQSFLSDFQQRLAQVDEAALLAKLEADEAQMNETANATLYNVQKAVGLRA